VITEETAKYVMGVLIGLPWPEGDPEVCRQAAAFWRKVAGATRDTGADMQRSKMVVADSGNSGASIREFQNLTDRMKPGFDKLALACDQLAEALEKHADELEKTQHRFWYLAGRVVVDIGVTVAFGVLTVGLGSAVTAAYCARVFGIGTELLHTLAWYNRGLITATYYLVDSLAYTFADVAALKGVDALAGEAGQTWTAAMTQTFFPNLGFDLAFDVQNAAAHWAFPKNAGNLWLRAGMRFVSSAFVYSPIEYALQGKPWTVEGLSPTFEQLDQKAIIHGVGRRFWTDPFRDGIERWTKNLLRVK
jgi:uncharacterized protein YukE